jgi:anti-sigma B factor antagonist
LPPATFGGKGVAVSPEFSFTVRELPGVHVVALHGELDIVSAYDLAVALVEVAGSTVVVDLSGLTFIDSSGISALVMAKNRILADGRGRLLLTNPRGIVRAALEIVGLSSWIVDWSGEWDEATL